MNLKIAYRRNCQFTLMFCFKSTAQLNETVTDHEQQALLKTIHYDYCGLSWCSHPSVADLIKTLTHGHAYTLHVSKMQPNLLTVL